MELHRLRDFVAVAEELSFSQAAKRLHVAQPSLSCQIKLLEEELGVRLLDRMNGRVSLTDEGNAFLPDARRVLALVSESMLAVQRLSRGETGQLNVGYTAFFHNHVLPSTLELFRRVCPQATLSLCEMTCAEQIKALESRRIDAGFIGLRESLAGTRLHGECVARCELLAALPQESALSRKSRVALRDLSTLLFVSLSEAVCPGSRHWLGGLFEAEGIAPVIVSEVENLWALLRFVAAGLGVALVAEPLIPRRLGRVVLRPLKPPAQVDLCVAWLPDNPSKVLADYLRVVRSTAVNGAN